MTSTLDRIFNFFRQDGAELQALCFQLASSRYNDLVASDKLNARQLDNAAIRICTNVRREVYGLPPESPWDRSMEVKISTLCRKFKEAVELHFSGLSHVEISDILGTTEEVAARRVRVGLKMLAA